MIFLKLMKNGMSICQKQQYHFSLYSCALCNNTDFWWTSKTHYIIGEIQGSVGWRSAERYTYICRSFNGTNKRMCWQWSSLSATAKNWKEWEHVWNNLGGQPLTPKTESRESQKSYKMKCLMLVITNALDWMQISRKPFVLLWKQFIMKITHKKCFFLNAPGGYGKTFLTEAPAVHCLKHGKDCLGSCIIWNCCWIIRRRMNCPFML